MLSGADRTPSRTLLLLLAAPILVLGILGAVPSGPALVTGGTFAVWGALLALRGASRAAVTRREADRQLADLGSSGVPDGLRWRVAELTGARERRALARALRGLLRSLERPAHVSAVVVSRQALWRNRHSVASLAARLERLEHPVHPRGIVLVRDLLDGGGSSPLYDPEGAGELRVALARVRSAIEPN